MQSTQDHNRIWSSTFLLSVIPGSYCPATTALFKYSLNCVLQFSLSTYIILAFALQPCMLRHFSACCRSKSTIQHMTVVASASCKFKAEIFRDSRQACPLNSRRTPRGGSCPITFVAAPRSSFAILSAAGGDKRRNAVLEANETLAPPFLF